MSDERLAFHEYADIFPMLPLEELDTLAADIAANGLLEPITLYEGKVLDGRNRYVACLNVAVDPRLTQYTGDDPLGFVLSKNLHRRQLTSSQRAVVALEVERHLATEAKQRQGARNDIVQRFEQSGVIAFGVCPSLVSTELKLGGAACLTQPMSARTPRCTA